MDRSNHAGQGLDLPLSHLPTILGILCRMSSMGLALSPLTEDLVIDYKAMRADRPAQGPVRPGVDRDGRKWAASGGDTMVLSLTGNEKQLPATPWGCLPPHMRVLFIAGHQRTGAWLAEAFATDSASDVRLDEATGIAAGLSKLREEHFDAVLVSHESDGLNALDVLDAIRAGTSEDQPIVVLGDQSDDVMTAFCFESGADAYCCVPTTTTRTLLWLVARAVERHALIAENRRLEQSHRHRLRLDHGEARRLLQQQRGMIEKLAEICRDDAPGWDARAEGAAGGSGGAPDLPIPLMEHYRELLRAYVIMGSGNLASEMERLAELLASAAVTPQQVMRLHVYVLEEMISGLGSRSARHVMNRADMLILEVTIHLAQQYRSQYLLRVCPPRQLSLPGFDPWW